MTDATPTIANRTRRRLSNSAYRPREYLTEGEVEKLIDAARKRGDEIVLMQSLNLLGL
jgi:hypothetical protein